MKVTPSWDSGGDSLNGGRTIEPNVHPAERIRGAKGGKLRDRKVVLGITGSIAAVKCVELIRELIRHGADVYPVMSREALGIVTPDAIEFGAGRRPVTQLTGDMSYLRLCGKGGEADLLLIAPCTANTLSKIAVGVDDTTVTTFATNALGSGIPIVLAPAMHESMYDQPIVKENAERLRGLGVEILEPVMAEDKAKLADVETIVAHVVRRLGGGELRGKNVVVIAGATAEPVDDVRVITNVSTGATGVALAVEAFDRGADVELWFGRHDVAIPPFLAVKPFESTDDLEGMVVELEADYCLVPAAISDYRPRRVKGKIPSGKGGLTLDFEGTPSILAAIRERYEGVLVGFKLESGVTRAELAKRAKARLKAHGLDLIVANDLAKVTADKTSIVIVDKRGRTKAYAGTKAGAAEAVWEALLHGVGK